MQTLQPDQLPFSTSNAILAFALHMAGVPFADDKMPCCNFYDEQLLFTLGGGERDPRTSEVIKYSRFAGMDIERAARQALQEGLKGHVEYNFRSTVELGFLLEAFKDQQKKMKEGDEETGQSHVLNIITLVAKGGMQPIEALLRLACVNLKLRKPFVDMWKGREDLAILKVPNSGQEVVSEHTDGRGRTVKNPGMRLVSLNASDETKKKLRL